VKIVLYLKDKIAKIIKEKYGIEGLDFDISLPPENQQADYAVNAAFTISKSLKRPPIEISTELASLLKNDQDFKDAVPLKGYVNIILKNEVYLENLNELMNDEGYFNNNAGKGKKINLEFVSANPVGPLNIVSGRAGAYGDAMANLLTHSGYKVHKEYYVNDHGRQSQLFAASLLMRYLELFGLSTEIPEDGYKGDYVIEMAKKLKDEHGSQLFFIKDNKVHVKFKVFKDFGLTYILDSHKATLERFGVKFDEWFSESSLFDAGIVDEAMKIISDKGMFYEKDGAKWFRTTDFGDDKDRVVKKNDGQYTYLVSDIAYMYNKIKRGFEIVVNILGPDHHGYIARLESIVQALGYPKDMLKIVILQQVNLLEAGEKMKMSKREGKLVLLDELLDSVGKDAARYYFIMRNFNSHLDFDIQLAKEQSDKNPVFYVQYAYARICNIIQHAKEKGLETEKYQLRDINFSSLETEEKELIIYIVGIPAAIKEAAEKYSPSFLIQYIFGLVSRFHSFYNKHRVVSDDMKITQKRLFLMLTLKKALYECFKIIGITPRENM